MIILGQLVSRIIKRSF